MPAENTSVPQPVQLPLTGLHVLDSAYNQAVQILRAKLDEINQLKTELERLKEKGG